MSHNIVQKNMILVGIIFLAAIISYQYFHSVQIKYLSITSFKECVDAGYTTTTSYPEKCIMPGKSFSNPAQSEGIPLLSNEAASSTNDYKNIPYTINGQQIVLVDGKSVIVSNQSLKKSTTTIEIFGQTFKQDINDDTKIDTVLLLKVTKSDTPQQAYYVTSAIALNDGYIGTNALYLDSNLHSTAFLYKNGEIVAGYTTTDATSTLKEKYFTFSGNLLKQITHN